MILLLVLLLLLLVLVLLFVLLLLLVLILLLILFRFILLFLVLLLVVLLLFLALEERFEFLAQLGPVGGFGIQFFATGNGLQGILNDAFLGMLLGGFDALTVGERGLCQLGAVLGCQFLLVG